MTITPTNGVDGWTALETGADTATVTITDDDDDNAKIAFGTGAGATSAYTATVAENVAGSSLNVPVTVSHLPQASTTFDIEVLISSTATENTDYRIGTKSVTFTPTGSKTQNLTVTLIDDTVGEAPETIRLKIAAADDPVDDLGDHYARDANGAQATLTITSEDPPPAPANLRAQAGKERLTLTWAAPPGFTLTGYDVHYTSAPTSGDGAVTNDAAVQTGADPSPEDGWVAADRGTESDPPTASQSITDLDAGTSYRVRVRAVRALVQGAWARTTGRTFSDDARLGSWRVLGSTDDQQYNTMNVGSFNPDIEAYTVTVAPRDPLSVYTPGGGRGQRQDEGRQAGDDAPEHSDRRSNPRHQPRRGQQQHRRGAGHRPGREHHEDLHVDRDATSHYADVQPGQRCDGDQRGDQHHAEVRRGRSRRPARGRTSSTPTWPRS